MPGRARVRNIVGWIAVVVSTALSSFWAFWGSIENFHEGWYFRELWRNLGLMAVQYLPWMFIPLVGGLLGLWRPSVGFAANFVLDTGVFWLFDIREVVGIEKAQPALFSLPAPGRLLVTADSGAWVVEQDGSKRLLGRYREASWSPFGRFVVGSRPNELVALTPKGDVR